MIRNTVVDNRLNAFLSNWPLSLAETFRAYRSALRAGISPASAAWGDAPPGPYWMQIPEWLLRWNEEETGKDRTEVLHDVLWGQVCLFYAVRIQDDLLDSQISDPSLAFASTLFLTECEHVFGGMLDRESDFWGFYRHAVGTTVAGILRAAELQRNPGASAEALLETYGDVDTLFTVSPAAICHSFGVKQILPAICSFSVEVGKVAQALDDLEDIDEDIASGRFNYAAKMLARRCGLTDIEPAHLRPICPRLLRDGGIDEIIAGLDACLVKAREAVLPLGLEQALELLESYRAGVHKWTGLVAAAP